MSRSLSTGHSRRLFLQGISATAALAALHGNHFRADERPGLLTTPRATSGDDVEPNWDERLTVKVGQDTQAADLV